MELNINANITFQRNKLLSLSGMYNGEMLSAPEYKSLAGLDGAGFHGGIQPHRISDGGSTVGRVLSSPQYGTGIRRKRRIHLWHRDLNGGGVSLKMVKTATWQDKRT